MEGSLNELRLFADRNGLHETTPWVLLDEHFHIVREGLGIAALPKAKQLLIIVPDERVTVVSVVLPKLPERRLKEALPASVEDRLLSPVETSDLVLLDYRPGEPSAVAAWDLAWKDDLLSAEGIADYPSVKVVAASWALGLEDGVHGLLIDEARSVLCYPGGAALVDDSPAGGQMPLLLRGAIGQMAGELRVFVKPGIALPSWVSDFPALQAAPPVDFDWRTVSYAKAPSLYARRRLSLDLKAAGQAFRMPALLAGAWLAFEILAAALDWGVLSIERYRLQRSQQEIFHAAMGAGASLVDGEIQLRRRLDAVRPVAGLVGPSDFLVLLTRLGSRIDESMAPLEEMRFENGQLLVVPKMPGAAAAWLGAARAAGLNAVQENPTKGSIKITP